VILVPKAVSDRAGVLSFFKIERQANSLIPNMVTSKNSIKVEVTTIDEILNSHSVQALNRLSVTINGAEIEAVNGMMNTMKTSPRLKVPLAGWYKRDNRRICDILSPVFNRQGFKTATGRDGGLFAWR
jgi:hypothetical protein